MSSKAELEAQIVLLNATILAQERALKIFSAERGVEIIFPHMPHAMILPLMFDDREHKCHDAIAQVVWDVVRSHGIPVNATPGAFGEQGTVLLHSWTSGDRYVVPELAAELITALLNRIAEYGVAMHRTGHAEGGNHLKQLATGEASPKIYNERITRARNLGLPRGKLKILCRP